VRLQAFAGAALYLYLPENILQMPEFFGQMLLFCAVRVLTCWDWLGLFSLGSKQWFCPYKPDFYVQIKNNTPL
jgi:hypothetical protein